MTKADTLVRQGKRYLLGLAATYHACWESACRHDDIDPNAFFSAFSPENPYIPCLAKLFEQYQESRAALEVWGYVGLSISVHPRRRLSHRPMLNKKR